jgi:hypothetical protein
MSGRYKQAQNCKKHQKQTGKDQDEERAFSGEGKEWMRQGHGNTSASLIIPVRANQSTESAAFALAALPPYPGIFPGRRPAALRPTLSVWVAFFRGLSAHIIGRNEIIFNCPRFFAIMPPKKKWLVVCG